MKSPVDKEAFSVFIEENKIFELAREYLRKYLESWYEDDPEYFVEDIGADFETVMQTYRFENAMVSLNKNFNFEPAMDTISCKITIYDAEDDYFTTYKVIFDYELDVIDDMMFRH